MAATPRIGAGQPSWIAAYGATSSASSVGYSPAHPPTKAPPHAAQQANLHPEQPQLRLVPPPPTTSEQLRLDETEEMLLLIGELEEQLALERRRADTLERQAACAAGVLPPDPSASPRELQLQRDELLELIGEMEEAAQRRVTQDGELTPAASFAGDRSSVAAPPPDSASKQTQLLSDAEAWLLQSAQLAGGGATPRLSPGSTAAGSPHGLALSLRGFPQDMAAEGSPARRLMEEARVLRQMIAARQSPQLPQPAGSGSIKKKALAQRAPLQRLSSNSALTPRQQQLQPPKPPMASPLTTTRLAPGLFGAPQSSPRTTATSSISNRIVLVFVSKLQAWARAVLTRRHYQRQRRAAMVIQRCVRGAAARQYAQRLWQAELATFSTPFK
jgi:hypothetical protein